jgi:tetratricopeptide (TPR) repeat protein
MAGVFAQQKLGPDSIIRISEEILALHSDNRRALALSADAYHDKGMREQELTKLFALLAIDSTDIRITEHTASDLAEAKDYARAMAVATAGLRQVPTSSELLTLRWRIALAMKDWRVATQAGEELLSVDTAAADADFFKRMASAFVEDSQPARAAAVAGRGSAKFPSDDELGVLEVQLWRRAGEYASALNAADRLIARNPTAAGAYVQRARIQAELKQPADSLLATLERGVASGDNRLTIAGYAASLGQAASRTASASRELSDFLLAVRYFAFAERTAPRDTTAFLLGAANLSLGQVLYSAAREQKSCDQAKAMQTALTDAQMNLTRGGRAFPDVAAQLLGRLTEVMPFASELEKSVCRRKDEG